MTNNNADQANHKDSNKEKEKKHDSGEIIFFILRLNRKIERQNFDIYLVKSLSF